MKLIRRGISHVLCASAVVILVPVVILFCVGYAFSADVTKEYMSGIAIVNKPKEPKI